VVEHWPTWSLKTISIWMYKHVMPETWHWHFFIILYTLHCSHRMQYSLEPQEKFANFNKWSVIMTWPLRMRELSSTHAILAYPFLRKGLWVHYAVCETHFHLWTIWLVLTKSGLNVMPLEATLTSYFFNFLQVQLLITWVTLSLVRWELH
jgi:hypothetical protein